MWKYILTFIGGIGVGTAGCYVVLKRRIEDKLNKNLEEQIEKEVEKINKLYDEMEEQMEAALPKEYASSTEDEDNTPKVSRPSVAVPIREPQRTRYDLYSRPDPAESEHPEEEDPENNRGEEEKAGEEQSLAHQRDRSKGPVRIPESEYGEYMEFDKQTLLYYSEDNVLVEEETDEEVYAPEDLVGDIVARWAEDGFSEEDTIYVRNYRLSTDYEICHIDGSFNMAGR